MGADSEVMVILQRVKEIVYRWIELLVDELGYYTRPK